MHLPPLIALIEATLDRGGSKEEAGIQVARWEIQFGDYWVVGGHPDAGKSALLATAAGLLRPLAGQYRLFGDDPFALSGNALLELRRRVGYVPEGGTRLLQHLTVAENVALPLRYHRNLSPADAASAVEHMLECLEIISWAHCTPGQVNRSARQRANLARALILPPDVLLLDNPVAGLPPAEVRWWLDFLDQLAHGHEGLALSPLTLVATADSLRPWLARGRQFALLKAGRWVLLGDRETLALGRNADLREFLDQDQF
jgi:ABC-type transporter Mla maintaining outer membrane lipid asymmetry ATPase subunit MlaF